MRKCFGHGTAASCCGRQLWSDAKVVVPIPISTVRIDWPRRDDLQCRQGKRGGTRCQRYGQFEPHAATPPEPAFRDSSQCEISVREPAARRCKQCEKKIETRELTRVARHCGALPTAVRAPVLSRPRALSQRLCGHVVTLGPLISTKHVGTKCLATHDTRPYPRSSARLLGGSRHLMLAHPSVA